MGLDWIPGRKARPGHDEELRRIIETLWWDRLGRADRAAASRKPRRLLAPLFDRSERARMANETLRQRYEDISISPLETLDAPRIGVDVAADDWARASHAERDPARPLDDWPGALQGQYVLDLVPACDGIPFYNAGGAGKPIGRISFRAELLKATTIIIGDRLLEACHEVKFAPDLVAFGRSLLIRARAFAKTAGPDLPAQPPQELESVAGQLHIVATAGRWCVFWGERGHFLEPSF